MKKYVYGFGGGTADGDRTMKDTLGGKGAGLAEMSRAGVPVPPGFTISTQVCNLYFAADNQCPANVEKQMGVALKELERKSAQKLGDDKNPLLLSVRSGAKFSMPGMMDTVSQTWVSTTRRPRGWLGNPTIRGLPTTATGASCKCSAALFSM